MKPSSILILAAALVATTPALAQQQQLACGDRDEVLTQLNSKFQETPAAFGTTSNGMILEVTTSESGSFTILMSFPGGRSCLIAGGQNWELWKAKLPGRGA